MRRFIIATVVVLAGCSATEPTADTVVAKTEQSAYARPATVSAVITNTSAETLFTSSCLRFERRVGSGWVDASAAQICPALLAQLPAGQSSSASGFLGAEAAPGEYRGVAGVARQVGSLPAVVTNTFMVQ
jgi:hypothetical protein